MHAFVNPLNILLVFFCFCFAAMQINQLFFRVKEAPACSHLLGGFARSTEDINVPLYTSTITAIEWNTFDQIFWTCNEQKTFYIKDNKKKPGCHEICLAWALIALYTCIVAISMPHL